MKQRSVASALFVAAVLVCLSTAAAGQTANEGSIANVVGGGSAVKWEITAANTGGTLTVNFPDGRSVTKHFRAGTSPQITLGEKHLEDLPDGVCVYELRLASSLSAAQKEAALKARGKDDDPESKRAGSKRLTVPGLIQSGSFAIVNGSIILAGAVEPERGGAKASAPARASETMSPNIARRIVNNHRAFFKPDDVIPDDLIVQGSACVGLDCVSGEVFGFDTIRLKENNTRLQFDDTSTSAGFPTNNWQIRANDSASGGGSFLAFVDQGSTGNSETGTIVFRVDAGASANSLRVSSTGRVGLKTATPALALHINESDTPDIRLEQNNSGGFSAQTWDIAGNEANFFVRDVTSGSRLPFRIRPGAPTSSIDISADGNVGIGTASPSGKLEVSAGGTTTVGDLLVDSTNKTVFVGRQSATAGDNTTFIVRDRVGGTSFFVSGVNSSVGIGTSAPTQTLSVNGTAGKTSGGTWDVFSDERLKNIKGNFNTGLRAVMQLQPLRYQYKPDNALGLKSDGEYVGFGAQSLQKVIPEAVTQNSNGYLMVKSDPILWAMLNAIKEQQKEIAELKGQVRKLQATSRRRRK